MELIFEDPPAAARGRGAQTEFNEVAEALRQYPKQWAVIKTYTQGTEDKTPIQRANIYAASARKSAALREDFEIAARKGKVYVRYAPQ